MTPYTPDPSNPRGRRSGSLLGSGTHDEDSVVDAAGMHDVASGGGSAAGTAQSAGNGATQLTAFITASEEAPPR